MVNSPVPESFEHYDPRSHPEFERIFVAYLDELNLNGLVDPDQILENHPTLGPTILEDLQTYVQLHGEDESEAPLGTLGDYTLRRQIGRGGMGVVYEAWENSMDRRVALKVLPAGVAADARASIRFMREAQAAGKLSHQNVVAVYSTGVKEGTPWYAMEYVEGETLAQVLGKIKEPEKDTETVFGNKDRAGYFEKIARCFAGVADGLQHAHSKSVVHRDMKPSNLILDGEGRLRILDFGLARLEGQESLTISGDFVGTPLYMSPEQARRKKIPVDHRTDIYSLGTTMYEVLTSEPPFRGADHQDTLTRIIEWDPQPPRKLSPRIPRDLETIVLKCLRKRPAERYDSAATLAQDLLRFARGEPVEARPEPAWERLARRVWRSRMRLAVAALAMLLVLSSMIFRQDGTGPRRVWNALPQAAYVRVSLDGRYLVFGDYRTGDLALRDLISGENRRLTNTGGWAESIEHASYPIVSPDSQQIAYTWYNQEDQVFELRTIEVVAGSEPRVCYREKGTRPIAEDWSADGNSILALLATEFAEPRQIVLISVASCEVVSVLKSFDRGGAFGWPTMYLSPDARYVAYDTREEGGSAPDIALLATDGSVPEIRLVEHPEHDSVLGWAPGGQHVVFASDRTGTMRLWLREVVDGKPQGEAEMASIQTEPFEPVGMTRAGSYYYGVHFGGRNVYTAEIDADSGRVLERPIRAIRQYEGSNSAPAWSPDGEHLACFSHPPGHSPSLCVLNVETEEMDRLFLKPQFKKLSWPCLRWSPDGRSLLCSAFYHGKPSHLYEVDVKTGDATRLPDSRGARNPEWSRDGEAVFFWRNVDTESGVKYVREILKLDLATGDADPLHSDVNVLSLTLSPDGELLAFAAGYSNDGALKLLPVDGGGPHEAIPLVPLEGIGTWYVPVVAWAPDGRHLLFTRKSGPKENVELWRVSVDDRSEHKVEIATPNIQSLSVNPDGRRIAFASKEWAKYEIWRIENFLPSE